MFDRHILVIIFSILACVSSLQPVIWQADKKRRKILCIILSVLFIIQNGFRDYLHAANDTYNYYYSYLSMLDDSILDYIKSAALIVSEYENRDPGYSIFVKLTQMIYPDFRFFLIVVAIIIVVPLCKIIYRYSTSIPGVFIAVALYQALFAGFFETGIRQTIAMGLSFTALLMQQDGKKIWRYALLLFVAFTIHSSAIVFLPIFVLPKFRNQNRLLGLSLVAAPVFMMFSTRIIAYIGTGTIFENYAVNSKDNLGTPVFTTLVFLSVVASKVFATKIQKTYPHYQLLFSAMIMALMLTPASWVNSNFIRLTFYYLVFLMPLLSVMLESVSSNKDVRVIMYVCLVIGLIIVS